MALALLWSGGAILVARASATFSGRNGLIFFCRNDEPGWDILSVRPDGSGQRRVTHHGCEPTVSADGHRIVFTSELQGGGLFVMNADGSGRRHIPLYKTVTNPKLGIVKEPLGADSPSFSPDGKRIVFDDLDGGLYIVNADGSGLQPLVQFSSTGASAPVFAPDGKTILFEEEKCSTATRCHTGAFLINPDGTNVRRVPNSDNVQDASFSPGGRTIVFTRHGDIFRMSLNGTQLRQLTTASAGGEDLSPQFSPTGRLIVFERLDNATNFNAIMVMNADGSHLHQLARAKYVALWPAWQPLP